MDIDAFSKGKGKQGKSSTVSAEAKGSEGQQGKKKTSTRTQSNVETVERAVTARRIVGARRTRPTKMVKGRGKNKNTTDAHILD